MHHLFFIVGAILAITTSPGDVSAQDYPNRTVRIVVPYAPGGAASLVAQVVGNKMSELMKQPVIVENRPGAGGNLGTDLVAKSAPDGYTLLLQTSAMSSISSLYSKLPFDPAKDFVPVSMVIATQFVIAGSPKNPPTNLREFIDRAKEKPGAYNFGSSGPGSSLDLFAELFCTIAGIRLVQIPYRGDAQLVTALIADEVQLAFLPQANGVPGVLDNLVRGLGVTGTQRMRALPNVPTASEQGIRGLEVGSWVAMFAPAGTPPAIVLAVHEYLAKALADSKVRAWLTSTGQEPVGSSPAEFEAQFRADIARFAKVVETANIPKLD